MWAELFRSGREEVIKMDLLLQALKELPEFRQLLDTARAGQAAAATGLAQINRAHVIAGL